jgi:hypothetical protein
MKKIIVFILLFVIQEVWFKKNIFAKDPIINLENFQKEVLWFYLGFNSFDFKIDYKTVGPDILVKKTTGFNVGIVGDLKLQEYINLRFEPGFYYTKDLSDSISNRQQQL